MWSGDSCECPLDNASCYDTRDVLEDSTEIRDAGKPCNGNGVCECGVCVCNETSNGGGKYRGQFCETQPVVVCNQYEDCILCLIYQRENGSIVCDPKCDNYDVVMLSKDEGSSFTQYCQFNDPYDDCQFQAYYQAEGDLVHVEVEEEKICLEYIDPMLIIIGIIGGIVAIGLAILFIWKLLTTIKDEREFKKFEQETLNPDWSKNENPIFKKATSTFKNPTYGNTSN
jgi:protocadherin alpha